MASTVKVWDRPVRLFHWSLAGSVALCWLTADELQSLHEVEGYAAACLIGLRLVLGIAGTRYARFSQFIRSPKRTLTYAGDITYFLAPYINSYKRFQAGTFAPTRAVLAHFGMLQMFPVIFGGDSLPTRKPDPAPLLATIAALGNLPALFVGDSEVDAETARAAGLPFLLFTEGYRKSPVAAIPHSAAFADWSDLPDVLRAQI